MKYSRTTIEKLGQIRSRPVPVTPKADGTLDIGGIAFVETGPRLFQQVGGFERASFREADGGRITHLFIGQEAFERLAWYEQPGLHQGLVIVFFGVFLWTLVARPESGRPAGLFEETHEIAPRARLARVLAVSASALNLAFLCGLGIGLWLTPPGSIWTGWPWFIGPLLLLPLPAAALSPVLIVLIPAVWRDRRGQGRSRARYLAAAGASLLFVPFLYYWNLLGFRF